MKDRTSEGHAANGTSAEPEGSAAPISTSDEPTGGEQSEQNLHGDAAPGGSLNVDKMTKDEMVKLVYDHKIPIPDFTKRTIPGMREALKDYQCGSPSWPTSSA